MDSWVDVSMRFKNDSLLFRVRESIFLYLSQLKIFKLSNMAKYNESEAISANINLIGGGTEITGDITSNGDIRIDGVLFGNITTRGKIVIGETGRIKGEITCKNADISGTADGKLTVSELIALKASSRVNGDITTGRFSVEPGARFTGFCNMADSDQPNGFANGEDFSRKVVE